VFRRDARAATVFAALLTAAQPSSAQEPEAGTEDSDSETATEGDDAEKSEASDKDAKPDEPQEPAEPTDDRFGHAGQFGLRAGLQGGYRMIFRYDESPFCAEIDRTKELKKQQRFCGHAAPLAIDLGLSYALLDFFEPFLWARFGLSGEDVTETEPLVLIGVGARLYTMSDSAFKIFVEPALGLELEGGTGDDPRFEQINASYATDLVFHLAAGPQFDLAKAVGLYLDAGLTTGILRSIHTSLEITGGVQLRAP
jgi:hypothetical protein